MPLRRGTPRAKDPGDGDAPDEPKMVLAGVRSQATKKLLELGFDVTARVVNNEVEGALEVQGRAAAASAAAPDLGGVGGGIRSLF